jgi:hypothetical protein
MMREITRFCQTSGMTMADWENMRWGEYLEISLANVMLQKENIKRQSQ